MSKILLSIIIFVFFSITLIGKNRIIENESELEVIISQFDQNYNNQYVPTGRTIDWVYPQKISGDWKFTFTGNKAGGRGAPFTVVKDVNVQ